MSAIARQAPEHMWPPQRKTRGQSAPIHAVQEVHCRNNGSYTGGICWNKPQADLLWSAEEMHQRVVGDQARSVPLRPRPRQYRVFSALRAVAAPTNPGGGLYRYQSGITLSERQQRARWRLSRKRRPCGCAARQKACSLRPVKILC
ncbi:hypothetical protein GGTG_10535 [Gaeumannomyces tritici R3-111a-1]|uniref:Uncharacterized protein n=1 Tax=Gaeumannomyces tritici (strain R3-111a-1) TaxID=644352 RepID=J3PAL0_GAET3|nr:hypothetical protein GGTG_10535 [Gaeumannomyces tritici R3-111a-1]EJT71276.1 hypothetical protein GGTG_10535 [Gaeumannomyces tritici R3-111a-1]